MFERPLQFFVEVVLFFGDPRQRTSHHGAGLSTATPSRLETRRGFRFYPYRGARLKLPENFRKKTLNLRTIKNLNEKHTKLLHNCTY